MEDQSMFQMVNPEFDFNFAGRAYHLRKATLDKAILYQGKAKELSDAKDVSADSKLMAYCIYIMLRDVDKTITEQYITENTPATVSVIDVLATLGFINPTMQKTISKLVETKQQEHSSSQ